MVLRKVGVWAAVLLCLLVAGCRKQTGPRVYRPLVLMPPPTIPVALETPRPIDVARTLPNVAARMPRPLDTLPPYVKPPVRTVKRPKSKPVQSAKTVPGTPVTTPPAEAVEEPETPVIELGEVMPEASRRAGEAEIDKVLEEVSGIVRRARGRNLSLQQEERLQQVRSFAQRSRAFKRTDMASAKAFAERALVLARELSAEFR